MARSADEENRVWFGIALCLVFGKSRVDEIDGRLEKLFHDLSELIPRDVNLVLALAEWNRIFSRQSNLDLFGLPEEFGLIFLR